MRIVRRRLVAQRDVVGRHELLVVPFAVVQQAIAKAQRVGGMDGDAAGAVGVRHREVAAMQAIAPRPPAHRLGEPLVDVVLQLHPGDMPQHDRGDVRRGRGIGVARAGIGPERDMRIEDMSRSRMFCPGTGFSGDASPFTIAAALCPSP